MKRLYTLLLVLVLTLTATGSALADGHIACGDLSSEDCATIDASLEAMNLVTSGSNYIDVSVVGMDVPAVGDIDFSFVYESDFSYSEDAIDLAMSLEEMSAEEMTAIYGDTDATLELLGGLLGGMQAVVSMTTSVSPETGALLGALAGAEIPEEVVISFAIDEGIFLIDLEPLAPLLPEDLAGGMPLSGWVGVELMPLLAEAMAGTEVDPMTAQMAGMSASTDIGAGPLYGQLGYADPAGGFVQFFDIENVGDNTFVTTVDYATLVDSVVFDQAVWLVLNTLTGEAPSDEDWAAWSAWARNWAPYVVDATTLELMEMLDDDLHLVDTDFVLDVDLAAMAETGALMAEDGSMVSVSIVTQNTGLDEGVEVEIPQGLVLPAEMLGGMLGGQ